MLLWAAIAGAADYRVDLEDALLARALGDHSTARSGLLYVIRNGAADDPARAWALYWHGVSLVEAGESAEARQSFRECIRIGPARAACMEQLGRLEIHQQAIRTIPTIWTFDDDHGIALAWTQADRGALRIEPRTEPQPAQPGAPADRKLVWTSRHDERAPGTLLFAVDQASPTPTRFHAEVRSEGQPGGLAVVLVDARGVDHVQPVIPLPADETVVVDLPLASPRSPSGPLDPASLALVILHDVTPASDATRGRSVLVLDNVGLR